MTIDAASIVGRAGAVERLAVETLLARCGLPTAGLADCGEELFVVRANGSRLRRLTRNDVDDTGPIWSPGGARIAFTRFTGSSNDVWSTRPNGSDKRRLTTGAAHEAAAGWAR